MSDSEAVIDTPRSESSDETDESRNESTAFPQQLYLKVFDGNNLLTPMIHPHLDLSSLDDVGTIFSHAYVVCGMLPVRIAFQVWYAA